MANQYEYLKAMYDRKCPKCGSNETSDAKLEQDGDLINWTCGKCGNQYRMDIDLNPAQGVQPGAPGPGLISRSIHFPGFGGCAYLVRPGEGPGPARPGGRRSGP